MMTTIKSSNEGVIANIEEVLDKNNLYTHSVHLLLAEVKRLEKENNARKESCKKFKEEIDKEILNNHKLSDEITRLEKKNTEFSSLADECHAAELRKTREIKILEDEVTGLRNTIAQMQDGEEKVYQCRLKNSNNALFQDGVREGLKMAAEIVEELRKSQSPNYWIIAEAIHRKAGEV